MRGLSPEWLPTARSEAAPASPPATWCVPRPRHNEHWRLKSHALPSLKEKRPLFEKNGAKTFVQFGLWDGPESAQSPVWLEIRASVGFLCRVHVGWLFRNVMADDERRRFLLPLRQPEFVRFKSSHRARTAETCWRGQPGMCGGVQRCRLGGAVSSLAKAAVSGLDARARLLPPA